MAAEPVRILAEVEREAERMVADRRHFHANPELSFAEHKTAAYIADRLRSLDGVEDVREGVGRTGVTAEIRGGAGDGPRVALRADMDALPLPETTGLDFASGNDGVHHACGHDGHMAILLGATAVLARERASLRGSVRLLFQPAEEGFGGAREMIKDGALDGVDQVYGLHLWNYGETGRVLVRDGPLMAASDKFDIEVRGKGGHGAVPQGTHDAIVAAAHLVTQLHTVVSRNVAPVDSAVLTVGQVNGGHNYNIIADRVRITGTVRTLRRDTRATIIQRMRELCAGVGQSFALEVELDYQEGYPVTENTSPPHMQRVRDAASLVVGAEAVVETSPTMGAEDFSYFLLKQPHGAFFFVGSSPVPLDGKAEVVPHHKSNFTFDERALPIGASVFVHLVRGILKQP